MITNIPAHIDEKVKKSFDNLYKLSEDNDVLPLFMEVGISTDYSKGYTSLEGVASAEYFDENGRLVKANLPEGYKVVAEAQEYGLMMETTKKEMLQTKDVDTLVSRYESKKIPALISSLHYRRRSDAFKLLNNGFLDASDSNASLAPDGKSLFGEHKFKSSDVTFNNKATVEAGEEALDFLEEYAGSLVDSQNKPLACDFNVIVVKKGGKAAKAFKKVLNKDSMKATKIGDVNIYNDGKYSLLEVKYITKSDAWFAFDTTQEKALVLDDIQKPQLDKGEEFSKENQKWTHSATGSMRIVCANLPWTIVGYAGK